MLFWADARVAEVFHGRRKRRGCHATRPRQMFYLLKGLGSRFAQCGVGVFHVGLTPQLGQDAGLEPGAMLPPSLLLGEACPTTCTALGMG